MQLKQEPISQVVIVSATSIAQDGRVRRQVSALRDVGVRIATVGTLASDGKPANLPPEWNIDERFVQPARWSKVERLQSGLDLILGRFRIGGALARAMRLPGIKQLATETCDAVRACADPAAALVIANDWTALPAAILAQARLGTAFHYDTHEFALREHSSNLAWRMLFPPTIARIEAEGLRKARTVSCVSPGIAAAMRGHYGLQQSPHIIRNTPDMQPIHPRPIEDAVRVLYHGLFKPDRGLLELVQSVPLWPPHVRLVLRGAAPNGAFGAELAARCAQSAAADRIELHPMAPAGSIISEANRCDIGIFLPDLTSEQNQFALPNKLFEYLLAGLMVIVPEGTDMAAVVRETGAGRAIADTAPGAVAALLSDLTRDDIHEAKRAAYAAAPMFTWQREQQAFLAMLKARTVK